MILITGASSGIGEATARAFAAAGKDLILTARRFEKLEEVAAGIEKEFGRKVRVFELDVSDRAAVSKWVEAEKALLAKVTVLVNNAGLAKGLSTLQAGNPEDWDVMIDTNIKGLLYMTRALLPFLIQSKGHIVNMGSVAGYWAYAKGNVYSATKFAVRAITESLRIDLSGTGVRVTEIAPGMVETEFSQVRLGDAEKAKALYAGMRPLVAADIAEAIVWCAARPERINIQELVIYSTDQASPSLVHRS
jgi:NADP-dependent 3-hydroxy acid dehydrogenase YdfG